MSRTTGWASPIELWCYKNSITYLFKTRISATDWTVRERQTDRDRDRYENSVAILYADGQKFYSF